MALDKLDLLFKKVFAGTALTDDERKYFEEPFNGRSLVYGTQI